MPPHQSRDTGLPREGLLLGYSALLALSAGFVNAVALLILAVPVGNLTGITTQLGMHTANPWLYEGHVLGAIFLGFLMGAAIAGAILAPTDALAGPRHAAVLYLEAGLLVLAAAGERRPSSGHRSMPWASSRPRCRRCSPPRRSACKTG